ncbi:MAG: alkaline phosphatase family protein, partial [Gemmatimonadaceae bacterium]|nr:alkaline phosphatase family protein [Gemmatimonadaceae bacterium]
LAIAAQAPLHAGPMVGWVDMREARLWVQTTRPARAQFVYWDSAAPARRYTTAVQRTGGETAHVATLLADSVLPGRTYHYALRLDGRDVPRPYPLRFRTPPITGPGRDSVPVLRIALGSCYYVPEAAFDRPGTPYGSNLAIMRAVAATSPDLMLWLGDNTYTREADWTSRTGVLHRWSHTRAEPQLQPLLGAAAHLATWDDHEYGPNDSDRSYGLKGVTKEAFDLFFPMPRNDAAAGGVYRMVEFGDVAIFLLDDRWFRSPNGRVTGDRTYWGEAQREWLVDALKNSRAAFKLVANGGQVLSPLAVFENASTYPAERAALLQRIADERIGGVVFLSGDRHHTELVEMRRDSVLVARAPGDTAAPRPARLYPLYDLTVSPLTAGVSTATEANPWRVDGTYVREHNFATLDVTGPRSDRVLTMTVRGVDGTARWTRTLRARDLR